MCDRSIEELDERSMLVVSLRKKGDHRADFHIRDQQVHASPNLKLVDTDLFKGQCGCLVLLSKLNQKASEQGWRRADALGKRPEALRAPESCREKRQQPMCHSVIIIESGDYRRKCSLTDMTFEPWARDMDLNGVPFDWAIHVGRTVSHPSMKCQRTLTSWTDM